MAPRRPVARDRRSVGISRSTDVSTQARQETSTELTWAASTLESRWHLIRHEAAAPLALCHHRLIGPIRRSFAKDSAKSSDGRIPCPSCQHLGEDIAHRRLEQTSSVFGPQHMTAREQLDSGIAWPQVDPDAVPRSKRFPKTGDRQLAACPRAYERTRGEKSASSEAAFQQNFSRTNHGYSTLVARSVHHTTAPPRSAREHGTVGTE